MKANLIYTATLTPSNGRKSFCGRAKVDNYEVGNVIVEVLISYDTAVAAIIKTDGKSRMFRLYDEAFFEGEIEGWNHKEFYGYSATTGNHLAAFHYRNNTEWKGKAEWCKMEPVTIDAVFALAATETAAA